MSATIVSSRLSSKSSSNIADELGRIDDAVAKIEQKIKELRQEKQNLLEKRQRIQRAQENHAAVASADTELWQSEAFDWSQLLRENLKNIFKMTDFRELQLSAMNALMAGEDVILIMATGGGKSLCYQLPAVSSGFGFALVISPLISLMEDQKMALDEFGVNAEMLTASTSQPDVTRILNSMIDSVNSPLKLLFISPEKLAKSKRFMAKLEKAYELGRLNLIAVDEVHCCSQWGHDFRPDYKFMNILRRQFPKSPILGLTATASSKIIDDVKAMLGIGGALVFRSTFNRPNLFYEIRPKPDTSEAFLADLASLCQQRFAHQSGIIYCFSRKESEQLAGELKQRGVKAACYHADLAAEIRSNVHRQWALNKLQVIVATIAFGMGIDKPDVRFVIHHSLPKSLENYYQESGRAGRDGKKADCVLYYKFGDIFRQSTMVCTEKTGIENLYTMVAYCRNSAVCRRVQIANHFGETWDCSWCAKMCDCCATHSVADEETDTNVSQHLQRIGAILRDSESKITAAKLADLYTKSAKTIQKSRVENMIADFLLSGHLKEHFHFTPYSIISYAVLGPNFHVDDVTTPSVSKKPRVDVQKKAKESAIIDLD